MSLYTIRYAFEHKCLPELFFKEKKDFIAMLIQDKTALYRMIDLMFQHEEENNPFNEDSFKTEVLKVTDDVMAMRVILPEPTRAALCHSVYMFFNIKFDKIAYYTSERASADDVNADPKICSWDEAGVHYNYGTAPLDKRGDFLKCAELYMGREYGMIRRTDSPEKPKK